MEYERQPASLRPSNFLLFFLIKAQRRPLQILIVLFTWRKKKWKRNSGKPKKTGWHDIPWNLALSCSLLLGADLRWMTDQEFRFSVAIVRTVFLIVLHELSKNVGPQLLMRLSMAIVSKERGEPNHKNGCNAREIFVRRNLSATFCFRFTIRVSSLSHVLSNSRINIHT